MPNYLHRGHLSADHRRLLRRHPSHETNISTYLPLRDSFPPGSAIISKAPISAFYGDPCLPGQFRGALVISLQPARNAPQQRRTRCFESERMPSRRLVQDSGSHTAYLISRGRVLWSRLTPGERNEVGRGVEGTGGSTYQGAATWNPRTPGVFRHS